jgi:flagellar L-ring protein precursor FlgH
MPATIKTTLRPLARAAMLAGVALSLGACSAVDRLANVGQQPALSPIENPVAAAGYKPVQMPMPMPQPVAYHGNSLWRTGSRAFFKDQRAMQVGDILTVRVRITDRANFDNQTQRSRKNGEDLEVGGSIGTSVNGGLDKVLPFNGPNTGANGRSGGILDASSSSSSQGQGSIRRQEQLTTNIAAVVTQVLPNGNLVLEGKQEVRVNFEVRELIVAGVVRPEDIEADNMVESTKIAQARIAYGGRGQITDVQQPRYGQQVMDILLPF